MNERARCGALSFFLSFSDSFYSMTGENLRPILLPLLLLSPLKEKNATHFVRYPARDLHEIASTEDGNNEPLELLYNDVSNGISFFLCLPRAHTSSIQVD